MQGKISEKQQSVGAMKKRRVLMADGRRYLIYYTFGDENAETVSSGEAVEKLPATPRNSSAEEEKINV